MIKSRLNTILCAERQGALNTPESLTRLTTLNELAAILSHTWPVVAVRLQMLKSLLEVEMSLVRSSKSLPPVLS